MRDEMRFVVVGDDEEMKMAWKEEGDLYPGPPRTSRDRTRRKRGKEDEGR